jgi:MYXO-CTERM domain-containing protein
VGGCRVGHGPPGAPATLMLTMLLLRMRRRVALQR